MSTRYQLLRPLGSGGSARVSLARDLAAPAEAPLVAVKEVDSAEHVRTELEALRRLHHPGIVRVLDADFGRTPALLVEELVDGPTLTEAAKGATSGELLDWLAELLTSLDALHAQGLVHGDLKPENVLIRATAAGRRPVLVDFGLCRRVGTQHGGLSGTLRYASPEVLRDAPVTAGRDLYAFGLMAIELLVGVHPFATLEGTELMAAQRDQLVRLPANPRSRALPAPLVELLLALVEKDEADRPPSALAALERLADATGRRLAGAPLSAFRAAIASVTLIGRDAALSALGTLLSDDGASRLIALHLGGERGMGRTRYCAEAAHRARLAGLRVVAVSATPEPADTARRLLMGLGVASDRVGPPPTGDGGDRWTVVDRLATQLVECAATSPAALLVVDDAESLDPESRDALRVALTRLAYADPPARTLRALLVGGAALAVPTSDDAAQSLPLTALSEGEVLRWLHEVFGEPGGDAPDAARAPLSDLAAALERLTQGVPAQVATLLEALLDAGVVAVERGVPRVVGVPSPSSLPAGVAEALARREAQLTAPQRDVLDLARAAGAPIPTSLLAAAAGVEPERVEQAAQALETAGLAQRLPSGRVHADLALSAAPARAAELYLRLTRAVLGLGARETVAGFGLEAATRYAASAARLGERRLAGIAYRAGLAAASELQGAALRALHDDLAELAGEPEERAHHLMEGAALRRRSGDLGGASERARRAQDVRSARDAAGMLLAEIALDAGELKEALAGAQALEGVPELHAASCAVQARALVLLGRYPEATTLAERALAELGPKADPSITARLLQCVALAAYYTNDAPAARVAFERAAAAFGSAGDISGQSAAVNGVGLLAHRRGDFQEAQSAYEESRRLALLCGDRKRSAVASMNVGTVLQETGRVGPAAECYRASLAESDLIGDQGAVARAANNLGNALIALGRHAEALHWLDRSDVLARSHAMRLVEAYNLALRGKVYHRRGELGEARRCVVTALDVLREMGSAGEAGELSVELGLIERTAQDPSGMEHFASVAEQQARTSGADKLLAFVSYLRGEAKRMRGDADAALPLLREAFTLAERHHQPELAWLAEAGIGRAHRERGNSLEARTRLAAAAERILAEAAPLSGRERELFLADSERGRIVEEARLAAADAGPSASPRGEVERLMRILEVNHRLVSERDIERLLDHILDAAISLTGAERGFVILSGPEVELGELDVRAARNIDQESLKKNRARVSTSVLRDVMESGEAILTVDAGEDARFRDAASVHALKLRSILCLPLRAHGRTFGAIYLDNRFQTSTFVDRDLPLARAFADQASVALENARLHEEAAQAQQELAASHARVEALNRELEKRLEDQSHRLAQMESTFERQRSELETRYRYDNIVGQSAPMKRLFGVLDRVTDTSVPVLVQGESGTGKELVARAIHYNSSRRDREFVSVNCAALTETLLESELFGHVKGAFTGADRDRKGLFEVADHGTLFLDEVADMSLAMQAKLLRALQEGEIWPVGARRAIRVDVRIVTACNRDLAEMVREGAFRQDLFFRLNVVRVLLPPLRDRGEDIALLVHVFMERLGKEQGRTFRISQGAMDRLMRYDWPGNVRELEACVLNACLFCDGEVLSDPHFAHKPELFSDRRVGKRGLPAPLPGASGHELLDLASMSLAELEERAILAALEAAAGNKVEAARRLGVTRQTLYNKLKSLNIEIRRDIRRVEE